MSTSKILHTMDHSVDPKQTILDAVGDISGIDIMGVQILVGTYVRPKKTAGGILLTDSYRDEDIYQGKVGLVLAIAPNAFEENDQIKFPIKPQVGDWVCYKASDGFSMLINGHHCRMLEDVHLKMRVKGPDTVL